MKTALNKEMNQNRVKKKIKQRGLQMIDSRTLYPLNMKRSYLYLLDVPSICIFYFFWNGITAQSAVSMSLTLSEQKLSFASLSKWRNKIGNKPFMSFVARRFVQRHSLNKRSVTNCDSTKHFISEKEKQLQGSFSVVTFIKLTARTVCSSLSYQKLEQWYSWEE